MFEEIVMRKVRFTEHQIIATLKSVEAGRMVCCYRLKCDHVYRLNIDQERNTTIMF